MTGKHRVFCVDACVGVKWFLREDEDTAEAVALLELFGLGRLSIVVPELFFYEVGNALTVACRRLRVPVAAAIASLQELDKLGLGKVALGGRLRSAMTFAQLLGVSFYDASYLAAAEVAGVPLVTCDRRLIDATAGKVSWVVTPASALAGSYGR